MMTLEDEDMSKMYEFRKPESRFEVVVEDDGDVCYGYLVDDNKGIISNVWLYNHKFVERNPLSRRLSSRPALNRNSNIDQPASFDPIEALTDVNVSWEMSGDNRRPRAKIFIRKQLIAILDAKSEVGWSRFTTANSVISRTLSEAGEAQSA